MPKLRETFSFTDFRLTPVWDWTVFTKDGEGLLGGDVSDSGLRRSSGCRQKLLAHARILSGMPAIMLGRGMQVAQPPLQRRIFIERAAATLVADFAALAAASQRKLHP
jgi:hypothetical protein